MFFHPTLKYRELSLKEKLALLLEHAKYFEEEFGALVEEERGGGEERKNMETPSDGSAEGEEEEEEGGDGEDDSKPIRRLSSCTRHLVKYVNADGERHIPPLVMKSKTYSDLKIALEPFM
jgi:hypothetical protein